VGLQPPLATPELRPLTPTFPPPPTPCPHHPPSQHQMRYNQEKERLDSIRKLQAKRQELQVSLQQAEARGDLARVADIRYGSMAEVDDTLKRLRAAVPSDAMLVEEVGPEQIAEVVSRWTGIPTTRLQQTEREKLLHLGAELHKVRARV